MAGYLSGVARLPGSLQVERHGFEGTDVLLEEEEEEEVEDRVDSRALGSRVEGMHSHVSRSENLE